METAPKRIMVYGVTGSGKTTLARMIGEATGLPWHSVDDLTWEADWTPASEEVQRERISAICEQEAWVLDTAYRKWLDIPLARVDLIVGLDYPRWFSLWRLFRRTVARVVDKRPICNGNVENLRQMLSRDSILVWHFRSYKKKRATIEQFEREQGRYQVIRLRSQRETDTWLRSL
ncbi:MAG: adenylate kinase [Armatimonadetes bacterium 55-13]|nr:adenylate kinase [Armatimonadota bacterium]OJU65404.1 MAG: adenylate kinase [Armatimonadetes bacterium 55-13]